MVTTTSSRLDISTLDSPDMELSLLRLAWCEILRLPGLVGESQSEMSIEVTCSAIHQSQLTCWVA